MRCPLSCPITTYRAAMTTPEEPEEVPAVPTPPAVPPPPPPTPIAPADRVRTAWAARTEADYRFVNPWLNVFLIVVTCGIFGFYLFYQLMRRDRDHNRRRIELLDAATTFAWNEAYRAGNRR